MMLAFNVEAFPPDKYNTLEVTIEIIEHFLFGVATEKGYQLIVQHKKKSIKNEL